MSEITILHLSDLHMDKTHLRDIKIILKAMFDDLKGLKDKDNNDMKPDLVFFTGDLVNSGSDYNEFKLARDLFIDPLMKDALNLSENRFFFVPGNHDIDRTKWNKIAVTGIRTLYTDATKLNEFFDTELNVNQDKYLETLHNFIAFKKSFTNPYIVESNNLFSVYQLDINGVKFGIGCLNSAWLAYGGSNDKEELLVCERQIHSVLDKMGTCDVKIALMHHPLEWLKEFDRDDVENRLTSNFDLLLTGHMHKSKPKSFQGPNGSLFYSDGGTLFNGNRKTDYQGYTILKFDPQAKEVNAVYFRRYIDKFTHFDKDVDRAPDGLWQPNKKKTP
ncbi:phosphohydrolase [Candidatus Magnetobacterium bavaricum]|uniref:Phosphohydrolase n=1 Tax=Candidatus Magnetobacterium bavaricum TaxID=29290 RepID=A0A0F3GP00_9BACT|nr:phosphohydrolase [Candidatus Magnetobacterium bavaricum]